MRKLLGTIRALSLRAKILSVTTLCILIVTAGSLAGFQYSLKQYDGTLNRQARSMLNVYCDNITEQFRAVEERMRGFCMNGAVQTGLARLLSNETAGARLSASNLIRPSMGDMLENYVTSAIVIAEDGYRMAVGNLSLPDGVLESAVKRTKENGVEVWLPAQSPNASLLLCKRIYSASSSQFMKPLGCAVLRVSLPQIISANTQYEDLRDNEFLLAILDGDHLVYPAVKPELLNELRGAAGAESEDFVIAALNGEKHFVISKPLKMGDERWRIVFALPYDALFHSILLSKTAALLFMLLALILALAVASPLTRGIARGFNELAQKMEIFHSGHYKPASPSPLKTRDELSCLNRNFDEMALSYQRMIEENYVKQLLIAQAQLKSLMQQLDPHFLYNTLETISFFARRNKEPNIPVITEALVNLLQCSIRCEEDCMPLEWEIGMTKSFVQIQQIRFSDILTVDFAIEEGAGLALLPKMTVQPLVENAIRYTLDEQESCAVRVRARAEDGFLCLTVSDDGPALEGNLLEQLKSNARAANGNGIGLVNIDMRVKLLFGDLYGLNFFNDESGACVGLRVPFYTDRKRVNRFGERAAEIQDDHR